MGGSGGSEQQTANTAAYPDEFKPIAAGAAQQILAMQNALPLAGFAGTNAGQTAGVSPFQQATLNFLPQLLEPSWGLQTLQNLGQPINELAGNAVSVGNQTSPFANALSALSSGGFGTGRPSFPGGDAAPNFQMQSPHMTQAAPQPTIAGSNTNGLIASLLAQLSRPIPTETPILNAPDKSLSPVKAAPPRAAPSAPLIPQWFGNYTPPRYTPPQVR